MPDLSHAGNADDASKTDDDASKTDESLTVAQFCRAEKISRRKLYEDWSEGRGPRFFYNGNRRIISAQARTEWRRGREAEAAKRHGKASEAA